MVFSCPPLWVSSPWSGAVHPLAVVPDSGQGTQQGTGQLSWVTALAQFASCRIMDLGDLISSFFILPN